MITNTIARVRPEQECYVCFEPCVETSPCSCGQPIHARCFLAMQIQMPHSQCKICNTPLRIEEACFPEAFEPIDTLVIADEQPPDAHCLAAFMCLLTIFMWYLLSGYTGKLVMMVGHWDFTMHTFFEFWSWLHALGATFITAISMMAFANCCTVMDGGPQSDS